MLTYYTKRSDDTELTVTPHPHQSDRVWLHVDGVSLNEVKQVAHTHSLDENIIRDVLDDDELPRVEYDNVGNIYFFVRLPWLDKSHVVQTTPLLAIVAGQSFMTLTKSSTFDPRSIASENRLRVQSDEPLTLLLATIAATCAGYEAFINRTSRSIANIRGKLRSRVATNEDFSRFISIEGNLDTCEYNLKECLDTLEALHANRDIQLSKKDNESIDDIILYIKQLLGNVASLEKRVSSIQSAHATISNNSLNQRMKVLTIITLLVTIPNIFYGMYGMNVQLPYQNASWAYPLIVLTTVILMALALLLAKISKLF